MRRFFELAQIAGEYRSWTPDSGSVTVRGVQGKIVGIAYNASGVEISARMPQTMAPSSMNRRNAST